MRAVIEKEHKKKSVGLDERSDEKKVDGKRVKAEFENFILNNELIDNKDFNCKYLNFKKNIQLPNGEITDKNPLEDKNSK